MDPDAGPAARGLTEDDPVVAGPRTAPWEVDGQAEDASASELVDGDTEAAAGALATAEEEAAWTSARNRPRRAKVDPSSVEQLWDAYFDAPGDQTRNQLVEAYQGLAKDIARRFGARLPRSVDRGDLQTAASVGLINAVEGFDPERGVRFESYCELRVKGALLDELRSQDWLPRPWRQRIEQQKRAAEKLRSTLGRPPADEEVAVEMGLGIDVYQQTFGVGLPGTPLGSMPGDENDEDGGATLDVVPDKGGEAPGDRLSREELLTLVSQKLTEQESRIVYLKYWEELPMREIGELTGLSESRVCKIHTRLIERLQDRFRVHLDQD